MCTRITNPLQNVIYTQIFYEILCCKHVLDYRKKIETPCATYATHSRTDIFVCLHDVTF